MRTEDAAALAKVGKEIEPLSPSAQKELERITQQMIAGGLINPTVTHPEPPAKDMEKFVMEDDGDSSNLYWPYIPDDEILHEALKDRGGIIKEHSREVRSQIEEDMSKMWTRKEGF